MKKYKIPADTRIFLFKNKTNFPFCIRNDYQEGYRRSTVSVCYNDKELFKTENSEYTWFVFRLPKNDLGFKYLLVSEDDVTVVEE